MPARTRSNNSLDSMEEIDVRAEFAQIRREMAELGALRAEMGEIKGLLRSLCGALPNSGTGTGGTAGASTSGTAGQAASQMGALEAEASAAATSVGALSAPLIPPGFHPAPSSGGTQTGISAPLTSSVTQVTTSNGPPVHLRGMTGTVASVGKTVFHIEPNTVNHTMQPIFSPAVRTQAVPVFPTRDMNSHVEVNPLNTNATLLHRPVNGPPSTHRFGNIPIHGVNTQNDLGMNHYGIDTNQPWRYPTRPPEANFQAGGYRDTLARRRSS